MGRNWQVDPRNPCPTCKRPTKQTSTVLNGICTKRCHECGQSRTIDLVMVAARNKRVNAARAEYNRTVPPLGRDRL